MVLYPVYPTLRSNTSSPRPNRFYYIYKIVFLNFSLKYDSGGTLHSWGSIPTMDNQPLLCACADGPGRMFQ